MPLNIISVSYQDLHFKGLISDLKPAALCDVKNVCRLSCHRCPNVFSYIDAEKIIISGIKLDYIAIKKSKNNDDLELHLNAKDLLVWLEKNNIVYQNILT